MRWQDAFYCLVVKSVAFSDPVQRLLMKEARAMVIEEQGRRPFLSEDAAGVLMTDFKTRVMGSISGIQFDAEVESDLGKGHVRLLVNETYLHDQVIDLDTITILNC